ncbi:hypothetical protein [Azospirillum melinis]
MAAVWSSPKDSGQGKTERNTISKKHTPESTGLKIPPQARQLVSKRRSCERPGLNKP